MTMKNDTAVNFFADKLLARMAYAQCEKVIRQNETKDAYDINEFSDVDWVLVARALTFLEEHKRLHFEELSNKVDTDFSAKYENVQAFAHRFVIQNFMRENYTMYLLECFKVFLVDIAADDTHVKGGFVGFIRGLTKQTKNGRVFEFLAHTKQPLIVQ